MSLVIAAGGTGGHVFPALAVAEAWRQRWPDKPIFWIGREGGREEEWIQKAGIPFYGMPAAGWQPRAFWRNLSLLYRLPKAFWAVEKLMRQLKPKGVFSTGGYPGFMPSLWAGLHSRPLFLLELNRYPGRTIRWLSRFAFRVFGAFPETIGLKAEWIGVPVRFSSADRVRYTPSEAKRSWGIPEDRSLILVLGGSQGSTSLNQAVFESLRAWIEAGAFILWQVGRQIPQNLPSEVLTVPFIEDMVRAYIAADIVVSRAGGSTLGELAWWGKAAVLVPSPHVAEDHQRKNAAFWEERGAALVVEEENVPALREAVLYLLRKPEKRIEIARAAQALSRPEAANQLAEYLHTVLYGIS